MIVSRTKSTTELPISLELAKQHLFITETDLDVILEDLFIPSAVNAFEEITKRALITETVVEALDCFPSCENYFHLERGCPLQSVTSVKYYDEDNTLQTFDSSNYIVSASTLPGSITLATNKRWPTDIHKTRLAAVEITYVAGYGLDDENIPIDIKHALCQMLGEFDLNREDTVIQPGVTKVDVDWASSKVIDRYKTFYYRHKSQDRK